MKKFNNTSWTFKLDKMYTYAYWEKAFTPEECEKITKIAKKKGLIKGKTKGKSNARSSQVTWLFADDDLAWVYRRITDIVLNLNDRFFQFDLHGLIEGLQFTNYKAPSDKYGKHIDRALDMVIRKLSLSIQLTDPKEYEGGQLYLYEGEKGKEIKKKQGDLVLFPSFILHEVKPVTKGERNSLVTWVTGKPFK